MLSWKECLEPAQIAGDEEAALAAEAGDLGQLAALELEHYLATCPVTGQHFLRPTILDDLRSAERARDRRRVMTLKLALRRFIQVNRPAGVGGTSA